MFIGFSRPFPAWKCIVLFPDSTLVVLGNSLKAAEYRIIAKHTKVDMIWVAGRSPTLVSYSLRGVAMNLKATTLTYLAIA